MIVDKNGKPVYSNGGDYEDSEKSPSMDRPFRRGISFKLGWVDIFWFVIAIGFSITMIFLKTR